MSPPPDHPGFQRGFTLPVVLVIVGAMLILAIGIAAISTVERQTARSYVDLTRAEFAVRAGFEHATTLLQNNTADDEFLIIQSVAESPDADGRDAADYLFLVSPERAGSGYSYRYTPLFSSNGTPQPTPTLSAPKLDALLPAGSSAARISTAPFREEIRTDWIEILDDRGRAVSRYAYFLEDLQARVDPQIAGNELGAGGTHFRPLYPSPNMGSMPPDLAEKMEPLAVQALWALDPEATPDAQGDFGKTLIGSRHFMKTPGALLAAAGATAPAAREPGGHRSDPSFRALEQAAAAARHPYRERATIPFAPGISPAMAGNPKLNLNSLLQLPAAEAVEEIAQQINKALPDFAKARAGGFPEDYVRTLAANAIDYADADATSTFQAGTYRGLDGFPLVSEFLTRYRWEDVITQDGRKYLILRGTVYAELWNMTDQPVSGNAEISYETSYTFQVGPNPGVELSDLGRASHQLTRKDGYDYFPPIPISLQPNEYRVVRCGAVLYTIDVGSTSLYVQGKIILEGETDGSPDIGFRMRWNGQLVDQIRGGWYRRNMVLNYPMDTDQSKRVQVRAFIPGHSYIRTNLQNINNMGDPRMSYYLSAPLDSNAFPDNYSPNRRTVRWETIYKGNPKNQDKIYGRVLPSEWPDGGHNSWYGTNSFATRKWNIEPDDPIFFQGLPPPLREESPARMSNSGRFDGVTELGRTYDPAMWMVGEPDQPNARWGDILKVTNPSGAHGGGNTLRIGRPEHPRFDQPGLRASHLLDLFHAGVTDPENEDDSVIAITAHINVNTASRDALRVVLAGNLGADPALARRTSETHETSIRMAPRTEKIELSAATAIAQADILADAVIRARPFASPAEAALARTVEGDRAFGNRLIYQHGQQIEIADAAAEEMFSRLHDSATVRSRNFRVWVVGQSIAPTHPGNPNPLILAESRRVANLFLHPTHPVQTYECSF